MPVVAGAIVPHAPLLLPELASPEVAAAAQTIQAAIASIDLKDSDAILLLTPHADGAGVYREVRGDLAAFGVPGVAVEAKTAGVPSGVPTIDAPVDHGVVVPLLLREWALPVVAMGVDDAGIPTSIDARVAVLASVNTSAGLSPRAPLTELPEAAEVEDRFVAALQEDVGSAGDLELPGTCSAEVIAVFSGLFTGKKARVLAHEAPVGVGYLVAEVM